MIILTGTFNPAGSLASAVEASLKEKDIGEWSAHSYIQHYSSHPSTKVTLLVRRDTDEQGKMIPNRYCVALAASYVETAQRVDFQPAAETRRILKIPPEMASDAYVIRNVTPYQLELIQSMAIARALTLDIEYNASQRAKTYRDWTP